MLIFFDKEMVIEHGLCGETEDDDSSMLHCTGCAKLKMKQKEQAKEIFHGTNIGTSCFGVFRIHYFFSAANGLCVSTHLN